MIRLTEWMPTASAKKEDLPFGAAYETHAARIKNTAARRSSAAVWELLYRTLLREGLPVGTVAFGEHGKPYFEEGFPHFSLSHAGALVAVSVSDVPTGVDVERMNRPVSPAMVRRCLSREEADAYDGDFYRFWCRKECIVKLTGEGLTGYPNGIDAFDPRFLFQETTITLENETYRLTSAFSLPNNA